MPRVKGKAQTPTLLTRTKKLRKTFKRLGERVTNTPNEAHLMKYLAGFERKLNTFDPDSLNWVDYEAKALERKAPPKKYVPLRVEHVMAPLPAQQQQDADAASDDDNAAAKQAKRAKKKKKRSAIDEK